MKMLACDDRVLIAMRDHPQTTPLRLLAHDRVGVVEDSPAGAHAVDPEEVLERVRALGEEIKAQLVGMDTEVDLVLTGLLAGETVFFLSPPGAAKTTLARMLARGVGGRFFRRNLTADTSRSDLFGPLDPEQVRQGRWQRRLSGVATATVANIDEVFRGSGPVQDMLLEAFEERTLSEPDGVHPLPLLLGIAASNELVQATADNAFWDRLILRKVVGYPRQDAAWEALLTCPAGGLPIHTRLDPEEVLLLQGLVGLQATRLPPDVRARMVAIHRALVNKGLEISPRRFLAWARAATAAALLEGTGGITPSALAIGEHVLWITVEDIPLVAEVVGGLSDPQRSALRAAAADLEQIHHRLEAEDTDLETLAGWQKALTLHERRLREVTDPAHRARRDALKEEVQDLAARLIQRSGELMQQKMFHRLQRVEGGRS